MVPPVLIISNLLNFSAPFEVVYRRIIPYRYIFSNRKFRYIEKNTPWKGVFFVEPLCYTGFSAVSAGRVRRKVSV